MCGIAGIVQLKGTEPVSAASVEAMCQVLVHRGPDDWGMAFGSPEENPTGIGDRDHIFSFPSRVPVGLGHQRLSIIDLSPAGRQPMPNEDGTLWILFNGEIYNFADLRPGLEAKGHRFRSHTDTEAVLHLYEEEGVECLQRLNGMFALAIWDSKRGELLLARDRFGIKPLYYAFTAGNFAFASEMKSLLAALDLPRQLNLEALHRYLTFLWVPEPDTILESVKKVPAGHWMRVGPAGVEVHRYWDLRLEPAQGISAHSAAERLRELLQQAVVRQKVADVPVGAFLSGGLDSSTIVSLMTSAGHPPSRVYAAGFAPEDQKYERFPDDLKYARQVAQHLGLEVEEIILRPQMAELFPRLIWNLDEPLADPAIIPAYLICRAAQPTSKVLLSGMGGDEILGGYRRHLTERYVAMYHLVPGPLRKMVLDPLINLLPSGGAHPLVAQFRYAKKLVRGASLPPGMRYIGYCSWMSDGQKEQLYTPDVRSALQDTSSNQRHAEFLAQVAHADPISQMLYLDTMLYLPGHNLNYTDKMSMAASVEVRVPFLDNDVVDFAATLQPDFKVRGFTGKYLLRRAMNGVLPREVLHRGKAGFGAPIRAWLHHDLRDMVGDLLSKERLQRRGLFDPDAVQRLVGDNQRGKEDNSYQIWALLTLELWMQTFLEGEVRRPAMGAGGRPM